MKEQNKIYIFKIFANLSTTFTVFNYEFWATPNPLSRPYLGPFSISTKFFTYLQYNNNYKFETT